MSENSILLLLEALLRQKALKLISFWSSSSNAPPLQLAKNLGILSHSHYTANGRCRFSISQDSAFTACPSLRPKGIVVDLRALAGLKRRGTRDGRCR